MGGDIRLVGVFDEVVEHVDDIIVLLKSNVEIEFLPLGVPFGRLKPTIDGVRPVFRLENGMPCGYKNETSPEGVHAHDKCYR
jgi:hypothetical protein